MAADLSVRTFALPTPDQARLIANLRRQGIRETQVTETLTMAGPPGANSNSSTPLLISSEIVTRPDRMTGSINVGPRVLMSATGAALARSQAYRRARPLG
jgi:hypothetical protein